MPSKSSKWEVGFVHYLYCEIPFIDVRYIEVWVYLKEGVSTVPGQIQCTLIPCFTKSIANDFVSPITAPLLVPYAKRLSAPMIKSKSIFNFSYNVCKWNQYSKEFFCTFQWWTNRRHIYDDSRSLCNHLKSKSNLKFLILWGQIFILYFTWN